VWSSDAVDLMLRACGCRTANEVVNVAINGGAIVEVGPVARAAHESLDLGGRLLTPGLVEAHIHLDKALLSDSHLDDRGKTLVEALALSARPSRAFTVDDIRARARRVLDLAVRAGTTAMRTHVEVDPIAAGGVEAILPLPRSTRRRGSTNLRFRPGRHRQGPRHRGSPASGAHDGRLSCRRCPYNDSDGLEHIRIVFALATAFGVDADFHVISPTNRTTCTCVTSPPTPCGRAGRGGSRWATSPSWRRCPAFRQDADHRGIAGRGLGVICLPATDST